MSPVHPLPAARTHSWPLTVRNHDIEVRAIPGAGEPTRVGRPDPRRCERVHLPALDQPFDLALTPTTNLCRSTAKPSETRRFDQESFAVARATKQRRLGERGPPASGPLRSGAADPPRRRFETNRSRTLLSEGDCALGLGQRRRPVRRNARLRGDEPAVRAGDRHGCRCRREPKPRGSRPAPDVNGLGHAPRACFSGSRSARRSVRLFPAPEKHLSCDVHPPGTHASSTPVRQPRCGVNRPRIGITWAATCGSLHRRRPEDQMASWALSASDFLSRRQAFRVS